MASHPVDDDAAAEHEAFDAVDAGALTDRSPDPVDGVPSDNTTLVSVLTAMEDQGFTAQLIPAADATILCAECNETFSATDFEVEAVRRLEGASDPDDMMTIVGARCARCGAAGTLVLGYGPNASEDDVAISRALGGLTALAADPDASETPAG